jgi:hypothetical protein
VSFDGEDIARLRSGEYTTFWITPGHHKLALNWRVAAVTMVSPWAISDFKEAAGSVKPIYLECSPGQTYFFGISRGWLGLNFRQITRLGEHFQLRDKTFVYAGAWDDEPDD